MPAEQTVRRRLLALVVIPALVMSALLGYLGHRDFQLLRNQLVDRGVAQVEHVADLAEYGLVTANSSQLQGAAEIARERGAIAVRIYDADGRLKAVAGNDRVQRSVTTLSAAGQCGERNGIYLFCAPVRMTPLPVAHFSEFGADALGSLAVGRVEIALSTEEIQARQATVIQGYALMLVMVIGIGFVLARRAEQQLARPIARLRDAVEHIAQGDLSQAVVEDGSGELLTLQEGLNVMAQRLVSNHAEQERRIGEATSMLRTTLQELEQRNGELNVEKHRAETASRAKSRFLAVMSHEIRTPLAGMTGMLTLLEKSGLNREQAGYVRQVENSAETLRLLIDDILDYSRIEAGKLAVFADPLRLSKVVDEVATMMVPSAADKELEFIVHMEPDLPDALIGDALRLRQVLINLVANAIKFTERGWVRIEVRRHGGARDCPRILFAVEDSGIGIPDEYQGQVFESFTQVDSGPTRRYGGSGLGAAISRELVHLMGGEIGLVSKAGTGSRFWFEVSLPVDPTAPVLERPLVGKRAAVVESDDRARAALAAALESLGAQVTAASDPDTLPQKSPPFDYLFLCEEGLEGGKEGMAASLRERAHHLCQVIAAMGTACDGIYDSHLIKPATRRRLWDLIMAHTQQTPMAVASVAELSSLRVLVAEDDDINARVIEMLLRRLGHDVTRACDGQEALDYLSQSSFDVAVLDIRMPNVDGPTVAARWRAHEKDAGGHLPMIALTANGSTEDREICRASGMDEFLVKPVSEKVIAEVLARLVAQGVSPAATG